MSQQQLFETQPKLTGRQQTALDVLRAAAGAGLTGQEAGEHIHAVRGCRWCRLGDCHYAGKEGRELLERLVDLGYATRRRAGRYTAAGVDRDRPSAPTVGGPGDFPEGF